MVLHGPDGNIIAGKLTDVRQAVEDISSQEISLEKSLLPQKNLRTLSIIFSRKQDIKNLVSNRTLLNFEMKLREELKAKGQETDKLDTKFKRVLNNYILKM